MRESVWQHWKGVSQASLHCLSVPLSCLVVSQTKLRFGLRRLSTLAPGIFIFKHTHMAAFVNEIEVRDHGTMVRSCHILITLQTAPEKFSEKAKHWVSLSVCRDEATAFASRADSE